MISLSTPEEATFSIVGDMADKIKNNVKEQVQQFSWKLTFGKDVDVNDMPTEGIMILNKQLKRLRTEFVVNHEENAILISPHYPYKPDLEYFFCAKCRNKKEICVAFTIGEDNRMRTFDQRTSMTMIKTMSKREAKKVEMAEKMQAQVQAQSQAKPKAKPAVVEDVIE